MFAFTSASLATSYTTTSNASSIASASEQASSSSTFALATTTPTIVAIDVADAFICLHERLILEEAAGTAGWFLELVGGERAVFFALSSALGDVVVIFLLRPTDGVKNLLKRRPNNGCNVTYVGRYIRHHFLSINTVSN